MHQSRQDKSNKKCLTSLSKLLDYDCGYESKESTREQFYDELFKHKAKLRKDNHNLRRQIEQTKQAILSKALGKYFSKLKQLSDQNQQLRDKHRLIYERKKPSLNAQEQETPRSPLHTPRSRKSLNNILNNNNDNSFSKINIKPRGQENCVPLARKSLNNQNLENLKPSNTFGRNSLKICEAPRRYQQLTERKMMNSYFSGDNSQNISNFSETNSMRCSIKSRSRAVDCKGSENIFINFIDNMLEEEKLKEKQVVEILDERKNFHRGHQQVYVNILQAEVDKSSKNIEKLQKVLEKYQHEIKKMQINLSSVTDMTKQLGKVKQNFLAMQQKCKNIQSLRVEVATKERRLKELNESSKLEIFQPPNSIQMMLRLFGVEQKSLQDPIKCKQQIKNLVKGTFQKPGKRKMKIKQLLDTIREGRKKFKQLMGVYEGRIKKLERKLVSLRIQESKISEQ